MTGPHVTAAAQRRRPAAPWPASRTSGAGWAAAWPKWSSVLDPGLVVIGGGVSEAGELLLAPARAEFAIAVVGAAHRPHVPFVSAALGNDAGMVGAADLARQRREARVTR